MMKKRFYLTAFFVFSLILAAGLTGCDFIIGDDVRDEEKRSRDRVVIGGQFTGKNALPGALDNEEDVEFPTYVLAFYRDFRHEITEVQDDGTFEIVVDRGKPVGMIFAGENDEFWGHLALYEGLDSLPLTYLEEDVYEINLGELEIQKGEVVEPDIEELDEIMEIPEEELAMLIQASAFFSSLARNADVTGDGKVDFLQGNYYYLGICYFPDLAGALKLDEDGQKLNLIREDDIEINKHRLGTQFQHTELKNVFFILPDGTEEKFDEDNYYVCEDNNQIAYTTEPLPGVPQGGDYKIEVEGEEDSLTFSVPDQEWADDHIIIAWPELTITDGYLDTIYWEYEALGEPLLAPENVVAYVDVQICEFCKDENDCYQILCSGWLPSEQTSFHILGEKEIKLSEVTHINMAYDDIYGNHYVVGLIFEDSLFFHVEKVEVDQEEIMPGKEIEITAHINNIGNTPGEQDLVITVTHDGAEEYEIIKTEESLPIGPGETEKIIWKLLIPEEAPAGNYTVEVATENHKAQTEFTLIDDVE